MQVYVYKGTNKQDHFLFLPNEFDQKDFSRELPQALLTLMGELTLVVDFDLQEDRKLPNADAKDVIFALQDKGYYFQMPPESLFDAEEQYFN